MGNWIAQSLGDLAKSAVDMASRAVDQTTAVDLSADWFRTNYSLILPIALTMIVLTFTLQLVRAAWRRDGQALGQAVTGTVSSVFFAMCAITFTSVAIAVVEALSRGLFTVANSSMDDAVRRLVKVSMITSTTQLGWAIPALTALGCAVGAILYWGMMIFRKVSILVLVVLAPLAAAGGPWEPTRDWKRRWVEATATVVVSKLVVTIIMLVGVSAIGDSDTKDGLTALSDIIAGLVVMALVLCTPFMVYKFVHWAGDGQAHDLHRSTAAGLQTATAAAKRGGQMAMSAGAGGAGAAAGGAGAAGAASPQGPSQVPGMSSGAQSGAGGGPSSGTLVKAAPTSFRYGAPVRSGPGDGGVPLLTSSSPAPRSDGDQGTPLLTYAGSAAPAPAASPSGSSSAASPATKAAGTSGASRISTPGSTGGPSTTGPSPTGSSAEPPGAAGPAFSPVIVPPAGRPTPPPTGQRYRFPERPPSS
ncbi:conjugal transfer protein TrbL family protein [Kitasatospora sp. NPDC088783]|uniref:SCO6881 family protein n=1 Tax=Kitasatospora sp. NPDC088783 TaxID=3364077 RepID=UPI0037FF8FF3